MSAKAGFIFYYIISIGMGWLVAEDIKHSKDVSTFWITFHILLLISDIFWGVYYLIQFRGGIA